MSDADAGPVETGGQDDRLLGWDQVKAIAGISRATAWRMQKTGDFPEPVPISPNRVAWWESELTAWKAARKASGRVRPKAFIKPRAPKLIETARSPRTAAPVGPARDVRPQAPRADEKKPLPGPPTLGVQQSLPLRPQEPEPVRRSRPRVRPASPDQIDFGF